MNIFNSGYTLLRQTYQDVYYPNFFVDKIKQAIDLLLRLMETGVQDVNSIQAACDTMTCNKHDVQETFGENGSQIVTVAPRMPLAQILITFFSGLRFPLMLKMQLPSVTGRNRTRHAKVEECVR